MRTRLLLAAVVLAGLVANVTSAQTPRIETIKEAPKADPWVGEYTIFGSYREGTVTIEKTADGYKLGPGFYVNYTFTEVRPGVLEVKHLGRIYKGSLKFDDNRPAIPVLRFEFCYEFGYMIGRPPGGGEWAGKR